MLKSMTAYGRSSKATPYGRWNVEVHSVNRKFLDTSIHLPRDLLMFDVQLRKLTATYAQRGQVTVKVSFLQDAISDEEIQKHVQQLSVVKDLYLGVARQLGLDASQVLNLPFLIEQKSSVAISEDPMKEQTLGADLLSVAHLAFADFMKMKEAEGQQLASEMKSILQHFISLLSEVELLAPEAVERYKTKLTSRIAEVKALCSDDDERLLREVMLYAEKVDIAEEIARLKSHIEQFSKLFHSPEKSVGRTMDFLIQEMNREVNTICSKSDLTHLTLIGVKMKGELEKIREQAQNIE